ncbi:unnamed protein product [Rhizophagus irregularis]|nr:unnamed protein product [Rhizophagus irregularis]
MNFCFSYDYLKVKYPLFGQRYYGIPIIYVIFLLAKISSFHSNYSNTARPGEKKYNLLDLLRCFFSYMMNITIMDNARW